MGGDHTDYRIFVNDQNTEKSPGDLRRLVVTQTPVKDLKFGHASKCSTHELEYILVNETHKSVWVFEKQIGHQISAINKNKMLVNVNKRTCHLGNFAGLVDCGVQIKENKIMHKYLDFPVEAKKLKNLKSLLGGTAKT